MVTFDDIRKANAKAKKLPVKGKDYIPVNERVLAFRRVFPLGAIETETHIDGDTCTCTARVYVPACYLVDDAQNPAERVLVATGTATESKNSSNVNRTSFVENCETSAAGRALGFAGFGIDKSIASAEEMANAELNDTGRSKISPEMQIALATRCKNAGIDLPRLLALYKVHRLDELNNNQYSNINQFWEKIIIALGPEGGTNE